MPFKLVCMSDLTTNQFKLDPSMDVGDNNASLWLPLNMGSARRA